MKIAIFSGGTTSFCTGTRRTTITSPNCGCRTIPFGCPTRHCTIRELFEELEDTVYSIRTLSRLSLSGTTFFRPRWEKKWFWKTRSNTIESLPRDCLMIRGWNISHSRPTANQSAGWGWVTLHVVHIFRFQVVGSITYRFLNEQKIKSLPLPWSFYFSPSIEGRGSESRAYPGKIVATLRSEWLLLSQTNIGEYSLQNIVENTSFSSKKGLQKRDAVKRQLFRDDRAF